MKNLEVSQMELIQGGWSWERCLGGALIGGGLAATFFPPAALVAAAAGCIAAGTD